MYHVIPQLVVVLTSDGASSFYELKSSNLCSRLIVVVALQLYEFTLHYVVFYPSI